MSDMTSNEKVDMVVNAILSRQSLVEELLDPRRDIDNECGYPKVVGIDQYHYMWQREGVAQRVVGVYPEESWSMEPEVSEDVDASVETEFEAAWKDLSRTLAGTGYSRTEDNEGHMAFHYLQRIDELSGIGHYGVLFLGFSDGGQLSDPVPGISETGDREGNPETDLLFLRPFDEFNVAIAGYQTDERNPRFGQPIAYNVTFQDVKSNQGSSVAAEPGQHQTRVHWSRVIHIADNRTTGEVFGVPRMRSVWNRLYDLRKILGGSGEMYWRGGFPGLSLETQPGMEDAELDEERTRKMMFDYMNGLQRYLFTQGLSAKSMSPQIADPTSAWNIQVKTIATTIGVPYRVFVGTEESKLAGSQDDVRWNKRLMRRQKRYLNPLVIRPFIDRLILTGVLPEPSDSGYSVQWKNLNEVSDMDRAEVAGKLTEAFAKYSGGGVDTLIPPQEYLTIIHGMSDKDVEQILEAALESIEAAEEAEDEVREEQAVVAEEEAEKLQEEIDEEEIDEEDSPEELMENNQELWDIFDKWCVLANVKFQSAAQRKAVFASIGGKLAGARARAAAKKEGGSSSDPERGQGGKFTSKEEQDPPKKPRPAAQPELPTGKKRGSKKPPPEPRRKHGKEDEPSKKKTAEKEEKKSEKKKEVTKDKPSRDEEQLDRSEAYKRGMSKRWQGEAETNLQKAQSKAHGEPDKLTKEGIEHYTGNEYDMVNGNLRDGLPMSKAHGDVIMAKRMVALQKQASKEIPTPPPAPLLYRGLSEKRAKSMKESGGDPITAKGFVSTSISSKQAMTFSSKRRTGKGHLMEIKPKRGVSVSKNSSYAEEMEVIQAHGTRYKYVGSRMEGSDRAGWDEIIEVEEI